MTDEVYQLPGVFFILSRSASPGRHSRKTDSVLNNVEQLATAELLGGRQAHIGSRRIQVLPQYGVSTAVIGVAGETMIAPMRATIGDGFGAIGNGIHPGFRVGRHG